MEIRIVKIFRGKLNIKKLFLIGAATGFVNGLLGAAASSIFKAKIIDLPLTVNVAIGEPLGGIIGAYFLNKISIPLLRKIFGVIMIIASLRMWVQ